MKGERVGVFVCHCGTNIAGVVDVAAVVEASKALDGVAHAEDGKWICSVDFLNKIKAAIKESSLDRVVVACCTPRTHEQIFRSALGEAGLNPFLLELVSIREGCSWVHASDPGAATAKAVELVRMGVARARLLQPADVARIPVGREALVIGGGPAGMSAALGLARQGIRVALVERRERLGGLLLRLGRLHPGGRPAAELAGELERKVRAEPGLELITGAELRSVEGHVGSYTARVATAGGERELRASTIIVATGMEELPPEGAFGHGSLPGVMTLGEFMEALERGRAPASVAFIACVRSRNEERGCCNIGCMAALGAAEALREMAPGARTALFYRDMCVPGPGAAEAEELVWRESILVFRYPDGQPPRVLKGDAPAEVEGHGGASSGGPPWSAREEAGEGAPNASPGGGAEGEGCREGLLVVSRDVLTGRTVRFPAEAVVLVMGYRGARGAQELGGLLRVPTDGDGFFTEAHVKLRPLDFATQGIHIAGCARSPKGARESIEEGLGAAMRALIPMCRGYVESEGVVALVEEEKCTGCGLCAKSCPFSAIELVERAGAPGTVGSAGGEGASGARAGAARRPRILAALCRGCGICAADCPSDAIQILHFTDEQILAQIEAALAEGAGSKILALCCHWCALGAADMAGVSRIQYPPNVRIIRVMCSGRVDARWVERALELGAGAVVVAGCEFPTCHYIDGNWSAKRRLEKLAASLERRGLPAARLHTVWLSAAEGARFAEAMSSIARGLGPAAEGRSSGGKVPRKSPS